MKNSATDTFERLETKRREFAQFDATEVRPLIQMSDDQLMRLGYVEIAELITDPEIRRKYARLAIDLLDANIAHYRPDATRIDVAPANNNMVIASTLAVIGIGYYANGVVAALLAAAVWYWFAAEYVRQRHSEALAAAIDHNTRVDEWAETLTDWQNVRNELQRHL